MSEYWARLAEAQRINQEIDAEFQRTLALLGRETAERVRRASEQARSSACSVPRRYA